MASFAPKRLYSTPNFELVKDTRLAEYKGRCDAAFEKLGLVKTTTARPVFGSRHMDIRTKDNYFSKLRPLVAFLLDSGKYDDSLLPFHPLCPKGTIACQAEAVAEFCYVVMNQGGEKRPVSILKLAPSTARLFLTAKERPC